MGNVSTERTTACYEVSQNSSPLVIINFVSTLPSETKTLTQSVVMLVCPCCSVWVRDVTGKTALVRYVDYGNEDNVPRQALRQLPDSCWSNRPLAVPCHAHSFSPLSPGDLLCHMHTSLHSLLSLCKFFLFLTEISSQLR